MDHTSDYSTQEDTVNSCLNCYKTVIITLDQCLNLGDVYSQPNRINLLLDTKNYTLLALESLLRNSKFFKDACALCADSCGACAAVLEEVADKPEIIKCISACLDCQKKCHFLQGSDELVI